jgi:hypothetical protein
MAKQQQIVVDDGYGDHVLIRLRPYIPGKTARTFKDVLTGFRTEAAGINKPGKWHRLDIPVSGAARKRVIDHIEHLQGLRSTSETEAAAEARGQSLDPLLDVVHSQADAEALEERVRRVAARKAAQPTASGTAEDPVAFGGGARHVQGSGAKARRRSFLGQNELGPAQKPYDRELLPSDTDATTPRDLESTRQPNPRDVTIPEDTEAAQRIDAIKAARVEVAREDDARRARGVVDGDADGLAELEGEGTGHPVERHETKHETRRGGKKS